MPRPVSPAPATASKDTLSLVKKVKAAKAEARVLNQQDFLAANPDWCACAYGPECTGVVSPDTYEDGNPKYQVVVDGVISGICNRWATHARIEEAAAAKTTRR